MRKALLIIVVLFVVLALTEPVEAEDNLLLLNGEWYAFDPPAFIEEGTQMVPARLLFDALDAEVRWNSDKETVIISKHDRKLTIPINNGPPLVNGEEKEYDVKPMILGDCAYISTRFAGESLGYNVQWDPDLKSVRVDEGTEKAEAAPVGENIKKLTAEYESKGKVAEEEPKVTNTQRGIASWYGSRFHGRSTASGERYNQYDYTAAHRTLPFGSHVRVTLLSTGRSTVVRINDRGPHVSGRIIDLSRQAAADIGLRSRGLGEVKMEVLGK